MSTLFNKSESLRDLLRCLLDGSIDGEAGRVVLDVIDELDCLPVVVEPPVAEPVDGIKGANRGRLVWYGEADNSWLGRMGAGEREEAYFTHYLTEVCYYPSGDVYAGDTRKVERGQGSAVMYEWATELGFTVDPCPFIEEEPPAVEPVGSDLDQLFAAFLAWQAVGNRQDHYPKIILYDDGGGRMMGHYPERTVADWASLKEGIANINALVDKA